jgi:hypothetical protein
LALALSIHNKLQLKSTHILIGFNTFRSSIHNKQPTRSKGARTRGQQCGDIELAGYLSNAEGPAPLVLDLRITHERWGSRSDPSINGHIHYPNDLDRPLNETVTDKIRSYRADYNNRPSHVISFITGIASTSGRLHSEFVRLLFLQAHRETDRFFATSGVQLSQPSSGQIHYHHTVFSSQIKSKFGNILAKTTVLRIVLNIDGAPIARRVDPSDLAFSLSSHRHSNISLLFNSRFIS